MTSKPTEHPNGMMADYGQSVRIECRFVTDPHNRRWNVYELTPVTNATHNVHGTETTEAAVWIPIAHDLDESAARALAETRAKEISDGERRR